MNGFSVLIKIAELFNISAARAANSRLAQIYDFNNYLQPFDLIQNLKIISAIISAIFLILAIIFLIKWKRPKPAQLEEPALIEPSPTELSELEVSGPRQARWEEVQRHINSPQEAEWKFAVIEGDALVDDALKKAGFSGESMGDRLTNIQPGQIQNLDALWEAHKIRNRLAHDSGYFLRYAEAKRAVNQFEKVLKELGVL